MIWCEGVVAGVQYIRIKKGSGSEKDLFKKHHFIENRNILNYHFEEKIIA